MHLAPDFPDDLAMRQLMELLHEELGLPERKTIRLDTAVNFDLGCDGADARHLMEALEERFVIDLVDYDAYRYSNRKDSTCFKSAGPRAGETSCR
jgi:acyl carrier protein